MHGIRSLPRLFSRGRSKPYARTSTVFVDELYACGLKGSSHDVHGRAPRLSTILLQLVDGHDSNSSSVGKSLLAPPK
jgi:hypothetical protein